MSNADRADVFRGLAHPLRRRVVKRLSEGDAAAVELCKLLRITPQALARHLAILRETGLVAVRSQGARPFYRLNTGAFQRARRWVNDITIASAK